MFPSSNMREHLKRCLKYRRNISIAKNINLLKLLLEDGLMDDLLVFYFGSLGWDSPSSGFTVFFSSKIFQWRSASHTLRYQSFDLGELQPWSLFIILLFTESFQGELVLISMIQCWRLNNLVRSRIGGKSFQV